MSLNCILFKRGRKSNQRVEIKSLYRSLCQPVHYFPLYYSLCLYHVTRGESVSKNKGLADKNERYTLYFNKLLRFSYTRMK